MKLQQRRAVHAAWFLVLGLAVACATSAPALAQEPAELAAAQAAEPAAAPQEARSESLGGLILDGTGFGVVFYAVLAIFSIAALTITLERAVNLTRRKVIPVTFVERLRATLNSGSVTVESLRRACDGTVAPVASILMAGVARAGRPLTEVEKAMEDAAGREMADMRARNRPLNVIGSVAPLVGLLGTVVGMIFAFRISSQAGLGRAELLAEGIYLALMTTAAGLTIAIPCLLLVAWFNGRVERYMREIDQCLLDTLPVFTAQEGRKPGWAERPDPREMAATGG